MERRDFLSGLSATICIACAAGLAACSKGDSGYSGGGGGGGNTRLTVDLSSQLPNVGSFIISGGVIIIRLAATNVPASFSALSSTCTHQGCTVATFNTSTQKIECNAPCGHGSRYNTDGSVSNGPATGALTKYTIAINGSTLTVT